VEGLGKGDDKPRRTRRPRGSLSQAEILDAAYALIESDGLPRLSMPILARQLRASTASIYSYFVNKDALLAALADRVAREIHVRLPPIGNGAWDDELVDYFDAFRNVMISTPIYREMFAYRPDSMFLHSDQAFVVLQRLEAGLALIRRVGLSAPDAAAVFNACSNYTKGFVILEHGRKMEAGTDEELMRHDIGERIAGLDPAEFPTVVALGAIDTVRALSNDDFVRGLRLLISGVR
jgi:AcrR family transcriptional regulator